MHVLFLLPYSPVPVNSGNKNLTFNLLAYITEYICCDLVVLAEDNRPKNSIRSQILSELPGIRQVLIFYQERSLFSLVHKYSLLLKGYPPSILRYENKKLYAWLKKHLDTQCYDLIHFDMIRMVQYKGACNQNIPSLLVASDAYSMALRHNRVSEKKLIKKAIWFLREKTIKNYEERVYKSFSLVCTVSDIDTNNLRNRVHTLNVKTIGIPINDRYLNCQVVSSLRDANTNTLKILCTGAIRISVVAQEIIDFINNCYSDIQRRLPEVELTILGRDPTPSLKKCIKANLNIFHIEYIENYVSFLQQDWVYVYPQKSGSGLQTKVQQAMALGLPIVGFSRAFAGLHITNGIHGFECTSYKEMADRLIQLLNDASLRESIGMAASSHVEKNFSVQKVGTNILSLYKTIA
ncbi:MAG: glycosyltransferase family 4 protein [Leptolyngbya sp. SIO3F4]|nr:glycosyltransferase family 4 protein [Leptolyngbya sp. SIO3F4]